VESMKYNVITVELMKYNVIMIINVNTKNGERARIPRLDDVSA